MTFGEGHDAGWHVLIGANGSGKSVILRSIALGIVGPYDAKALHQNWNDWVGKGESEGSISLSIIRSFEDRYINNQRPLNRPFNADVILKQDSLGSSFELMDNSKNDVTARNYVWNNARGWFSVAYGPFRRFS